MSISGNSDSLSVGIAQISPVWLNEGRTFDKIIEYVNSAGHEGCQIIVFGEALLPGYPLWIERADGARFNSPCGYIRHGIYGTSMILCFIITNLYDIYPSCHGKRE